VENEARPPASRVRTDNEDGPHQAERAFGARVRELRAVRKWTQEALAERMTAMGLPMHQTTVAKLESGSRPTSVAEVASLAAIFGVDMSELFAQRSAVLPYEARAAEHLRRIERYADAVAAARDNLREAQMNLETWLSGAQDEGWTPSERALALMNAAMDTTPEDIAAEPTLTNDDVGHTG
jgi:transcriptional regulator with XRE-family HTH domain